MKVGIYLDNSALSGMDFRHPERGNPGTGAAEYLHVALAYFIRKYAGSSVETHIFAQHTNLMPPKIPSHSVLDVVDAAKKAKSAGMDIFVFRPRMREELNILDVIDDLGLPSIGRAALTPSPEHVRRMARSTMFKALVCVGGEQYDSLVDTPVHSKIVQIDNGLHLESCRNGLDVVRDESLVVYMGALVPQKGFPLLASAWPTVLSRNPHAKLSVIGSPKIYNESATLGPLGVADAEFEARYIEPYLTLADGQLHPSVMFHGQMGAEKHQILRQATVGVPNPSGQTETFCVSAAEMSACGAAVVSGAYYGLLDTVRHEKTGLLGRSVSDLVNNISALLENPARARSLGKNGVKFVEERFDFSVVVPKWVTLFNDVAVARKRKLAVPTRNLLRHYKFMRIANMPFQRTLGKLMFWPSVQEAEKAARTIKGKLRA